MSTQVQRRKGTTVQHSTFTGASAELTVDTTKNTVVVHDGATAGGIPLAKETGSALSATSLSLPNSTTNGVAFVNGSKVVVAGSTFTFDGTSLSVNGITVGKGAGSSSFNTAVGELALGANTSSATNTAVGYNAMKAITTGSGNTAVGAVALTLASDTGNNTAIGRGALFPSTGTQNTALGYNAGGSMSSGSKNVIIGSFSGNDISYGTGFDIRTLNNYIVLSDGDANVRAYWNGANPTFPGVLTLSDGTANGVPYLNGSKQVTTGSALTFDGTNLVVNGATATGRVTAKLANTAGFQSMFSVQNATSTGQLASIGLNLSNDEFTLGTDYGAAVVFKYNGSEGMRLTSSGLEVKQSQLIGYSSYAGIGTNGLAVAGNVGIGTSSPGAKLDVAGTIRATVVSSGNYAIYNAPTNGGYATYQASGADIAYVGSALPVFGAGTSTDFAITATSGKSLFLGSNAIKQATLDSSGNLGLGMVPSAWQTTNGAKALQVAGAALFSRSGLTSVIATNAYYNTSDTWIYQASGLGATHYEQFAGSHLWFRSTSAQVAGTDPVFSQAMMLDASGNLLVGKTSMGTGIAGLQFGPGAGAYLNITNTSSGSGDELIFLVRNGLSGSGNYIEFVYGSTAVGSVSCTSVATLYNTTSDQRLKENIADAASASALIDAIQVRQYNWKADGSHQRYGFVAQELVVVAPEAVHQPENPEDMMAVDYSKLVPMLVKEIQDLRKRLAAAGIA